MKIHTLLAVLFAVPGCFAMTGCADMLRSDNANAQRQSVRANAAALEASKTASSQALPATPVSGDALVRLLSGNTHVSEYRKQMSDAKPYFTLYQYYGPDGVFIVRDTYSRSTLPYQAVGRWRVTGDVLCVTEYNGPGSEGCFTAKLQANGVIQFWHHKPGDAFHNLITSSVSIVRPGLQTPEYMTSPSAYR